MKSAFLLSIFMPFCISNESKRGIFDEVCFLIVYIYAILHQQFIYFTFGIHFVKYALISFDELICLDCNIATVRCTQTLPVLFFGHVYKPEFVNLRRFDFRAVLTLMIYESKPLIKLATF